MMLRLSHKKLDVWKQSMFLIKKVYIFTKNLPSDEKFNLVSQMRRSAISVASNIAEGLSRTTNKEKQRFIEISRSSLVKLDTLNLNWFSDSKNCHFRMFLSEIH